MISAQLARIILAGAFLFKLAAVLLYVTIFCAGCWAGGRIDNL